MSHYSFFYQFHFQFYFNTQIFLPNMFLNFLLDCIPLCRVCFHCCMLLGATDYMPFALPLTCLSVCLSVCQYLLCLSCLRLQRCLPLSTCLSLPAPAVGSCRRVCVQFTRPASSGKQRWQAASCRRRHCDHSPDMQLSCKPCSVCVCVCVYVCLLGSKCWKHVNC